MARMILGEAQVAQLVRENRFKVKKGDEFVARCIDGRYTNTELPGLAMPGADTGQLAIILSAANAFGFKVDPKKAEKSLREVTANQINADLDCDYFDIIESNKLEFNLTQEDIDYLKTIDRKDSRLTIEGEHSEGATLMLRGDWSVIPRYLFGENEEENLAEVFVFHQSLVNFRHKQLANRLFKNKAVEIVGDGDEDYLYMTLTETCDSHLFEYLKRVGKGLPIYEINFDEAGEYSLKKLDEIS